ncbi:adenylate kinase family protein [Phragmitibacter flavus]|nr:nucleoside monophosphate kinase [Phragmitibacter flavus]
MSQAILQQHSSEKPVVVLLGGPGSGKGTHGQALAKSLGYRHLSTGTHFRDHILRETSLGRQAKEFIKAGQLVPDEVTNKLVQTMLGDGGSASGFVLDGYPRSVDQAEALDVMVPLLECVVTQSLYLVVSEEEMVRRLSGRLTCRACGQSFHETSRPPVLEGVCDACGGELFRRADDEPATIRQRVAVFQQVIRPLLEFYRGTGRLLEVAAEGPVEEVTARVIKAAAMVHNR